MMLSSRYLLCGFVQFLPSRIFRRLLHQDEKSPQQTMLSEICLPKQRELLSALVYVIKTSFNQTQKEPNHKKTAKGKTWVESERNESRFLV